VLQKCLVDDITMTSKKPVLPVVVWQKSKTGGGKFYFYFLFRDMLCNITQQLIKTN